MSRDRTLSLVPPEVPVEHAAWAARPPASTRTAPARTHEPSDHAVIKGARPRLLLEPMFRLREQALVDTWTG
jgi:hypothetical protein